MNHARSLDNSIVTKIVKTAVTAVIKQTQITGTMSARWTREEARAAIKAADLAAMSESAREAADNSWLASDDLRRSLPVIHDSLEQLREVLNYGGVAGICDIWFTTGRVKRPR